MTVARTAGLALLLVTLLTWLLLRSLGPSETYYLENEHALHAIAMSEAHRNDDVLRARVGLLQNYDPVVDHSVKLHLAIAKLGSVVGGAAPEAVTQLEGKVAKADALIETFKTDNALLQNSLAYFDLQSRRIEGSAMSPDVKVAAAIVTSAILHLTHDASPDVVLSVKASLDGLTAKKLSPDVASEMGRLALHGLLLADLLPKADNIIRQLPDLRTFRERDAIRSGLRQVRSDAEMRAKRYRIALYLAALALVAVLVRAGLQIRTGTLALRQRAELEHLVAQVSNSFISCEPEQIRSRIGDGLATLGSSLFNRAYLIICGEQPELQVWTWPGSIAKPGWPEAILGVLPALTASPVDVFSKAVDLKSVPEPVLELLRMFEVPHWGAAKMWDRGQMIGLLCLEAKKDRPAWLSEAFGRLRLATDAFGNALIREKMIQERVALEARLRRAQRLETVGTLASGVAHNFNNAIGVMVGHAEMAHDALEPGTRSAGHIQQILLAAARAQEVIEQILEYGRRSEAVLRPVELGEMVAETVSLMHSSLQGKVSLVVDIPRDDTWVVVERTRLQQVLVNLIRNAAQASEPGGEVAISLSATSWCGPRNLSHGALQPGRCYSRLRCIDYGSGIDEGTLSQLFQPFFTTRPGGTGIGLATAREVVNDVGGAFHVLSAPGQGSTFEVWLPVASRSELAKAGSRAGSGQSIILAVSDPFLLRRDEELLAALDYEPVGFGTAAAALSAIEAAPNRFDAVIVDETLSDMDGLQLAAQLRRAAPSLPIVMTVRDSESLNPNELHKGGVDEVFWRPLHGAAVGEVLRRLTRTQAIRPQRSL